MRTIITWLHAFACRCLDALAAVAALDVASSAVSNSGSDQVVVSLAPAAAPPNRRSVGLPPAPARLQPGGGGAGRGGGAGARLLRQPVHAVRTALLHVPLRPCGEQALLDS